MLAELVLVEEHPEFFEGEKGPKLLEGRSENISRDNRTSQVDFIVVVTAVDLYPTFR